MIRESICDLVFSLIKAVWLLVTWFQQISYKGPIVSERCFTGDPLCIQSLRTTTDSMLEKNSSRAEHRSLAFTVCGCSNQTNRLNRTDVKSPKTDDLYSLRSRRACSQAFRTQITAPEQVRGARQCTTINKMTYCEEPNPVNCSHFLI